MAASLQPPCRRVTPELGRRARGLAVSVAVGLAGLGLAWVAPARANDLSADEIMQRVYDRDDGDNSSSDVEMTLIDSAGARRERVLRAFSRDSGPDTQQLLFFLSPADVEDIGFLTYDYAGIERDDDQWLYLPALGKVKRIATSDQSGKFLGTDFSFADLTERENSEYSYTIEAENDPVRGEPAWRILARPKPREIERTGYTQSRIWVLKESFVVVRAIHSVREGDKKKYYDVSRLELVDGIWSPLEMTMTTKLRDNTTDHRTLVRVSNLRYGQGHASEMFTTRQLEKGP